MSILPKTFAAEIPNPQPTTQLLLRSLVPELFHSYAPASQLEHPVRRVRPLKSIAEREESYFETHVYPLVMSKIVENLI